MKWFKHLISIATFASIIIFLYAGNSIEESHIIHGSLFFIYSLFVFCTLLMYRISLIGRSKIKWVTLILTVLILSSLSIIKMNMAWYYDLWSITLAGFILLSGDAIFQIIHKNRPLTLVSKIGTALLLTSLLSMLAFGTESPTMYSFTEILLILVALLLIGDFFIKKNRA